MNKSQLKNAVLQSIDDSIQAALEAAQAAQESAAHENNQPENQYDTLSLEAAYLAHGQSERILGLQEDRITIARWVVLDYGDDDDIGTGALVYLKREEERGDGSGRWLWLALIGGWQITVDGQRVQVISVQAPLATQLIGKGLNDDVVMSGQSWQIVYIA